VPVPNPYPRPYRIAPGDTLWDIAGKLYGDSWAWPLLWGWNRDHVRDPDRIWPDQRLQWHGQGALYVVTAGDTLWDIAQRHWGHGERWQRLWQANRGWLSRPQALPVGARLWIPG